MATVDEAVNSYMAAIKTMDLGTLMASMTPDALGKAMSSGSAPPSGIKEAKAERQSEADGEYTYHIIVEADSGGGTMMTKWKEIDGAWKVTDMAQVE